MTRLIFCCTLLHVSNKPKNPVTVNPQRIYGRTPFKYSDEIRLLAMSMRDNGSSRKEIAKTLGISTSTVHAFISQSKLDDISHSDLASKVKARMASDMILNANSLFDAAMSEEKTEKASTLQLVTAGSILVDKARLLAGESTENISVRVKHVNETDSELKSIREEIMRLEKGINGEIVEQSDSDTIDVEPLDYGTVEPLKSGIDYGEVGQLDSWTVEEIDFI